jgi:hypothetical protein
LKTSLKWFANYTCTCMKKLGSCVRIMQSWDLKILVIVFCLCATLPMNCMATEKKIWTFFKFRIDSLTGCWSILLLIFKVEMIFLSG